MKNHVIKLTHVNGKPLPTEISWCGKSILYYDFCFQDAQHALLSVEQNTTAQPCKHCLNAIRKVINEKLPS